MRYRAASLWPRVCMTSGPCAVLALGAGVRERC